MYKRDDPAVIDGEICDKCNRKIRLNARYRADDNQCTCYYITLDLEWMTTNNQDALENWEQYAVTWDPDA